MRFASSFFPPCLPSDHPAAMKHHLKPSEQCCHINGDREQQHGENDDE